MAIRNWKDIPLFKDVTDEQWNDWHWQVEHRLSTVEEIAQVVNLTEKEREDIEKVMGGFRVGITPYYASLMDPDDPRDPVRMQAVPTLAEMHRSAADDWTHCTKMLTLLLRDLPTDIRTEYSS